MTTLGRWSPWILVVLAAALFGATSRSAADADRGPCAVLTGTDSAIREVRCVRASSAEEWAALWLEHKGLPAKAPYDFYYNLAGVPQIDFATHVVVGVFLGESNNCAGLEAVTAEPAGDRALLRYAEKSYQTLGEAEAVRPYGLFVLPRPDGALDVEELVRSMSGATRIEPRASFPKLR